MHQKQFTRLLGLAEVRRGPLLRRLERAVQELLAAVSVGVRGRSIALVAVLAAKCQKGPAG